MSNAAGIDVSKARLDVSAAVGSPRRFANTTAGIAALVQRPATTKSMPVYRAGDHSLMGILLQMPRYKSIFHSLMVSLSNH